MTLLFVGQAASLLIPLVFSGLVLIACIKKGWLTSLDVPVDNGRTWRGRPLLGRNKTYRGVIIHFGAAIFATSVLWWLQPSAQWIAPVYASSPILLGIAFAASYEIGEFANSFVKRRLGVSPGKSMQESWWLRRIQYFFDTADGIIVASVVLVCCFHVPPENASLAFVLAYLTHLAIDSLMRRLGLKKRQK